MPVRQLVRYPDALLRTPCEAVEMFDHRLARLCHDLIDTMRAAPGIGITGPHIGVLKRVTVIALSPRHEPRIYVNPMVVEASAERARHEEGSVSMPGIVEQVERPARVLVQFDAMDGKKRTEEAAGFLAACLQHEIDQLDGIFWIQRLSRLRRERVLKRWSKTGR